MATPRENDVGAVADFDEPGAGRVTQMSGRLVLQQRGRADRLAERLQPEEHLPAP